MKIMILILVILVIILIIMCNININEIILMKWNNINDIIINVY